MTTNPALSAHTIALIGLPGVGKSSIGRRLAASLDMPFRDADEEIERAAGRTISEIFAERGEAEFRDGERRVIARLLDQPPHVLATGGGSPFLKSSGRFIGPGHIGIVDTGVTNGPTRFSYHYYDADTQGRSRLAIGMIDWSDGWPVAVK